MDASWRWSAKNANFKRGTKHHPRKNNVQHLKANLDQAARFSIRIENRQAAETALLMINAGALRTRAQVHDYINKALEKARLDREAKS